MKIAETVIDKRASALLIDGRCIDAGLELQEQWQPYIITKNKEQAKALYEDDKNHVLQGGINDVLISTNWAKAAVFMPENYPEFKFFTQRVTALEGIVIYSFNQLFKEKENFEDALKKHFDVCREVLGINNTTLVQENGKKYLVGFRTHKTLLSHQKFDDFKKLFYGPIIDVSITKIRLKGITTRWFHPSEFQEKEQPEWKTDYLFEQQTTTEKFFSDAIKPKFLGGTVELPNHEQLAILLASGAIDREVELADGRIVVLKGTEFIDTKERIKCDIEGKPNALVKQQVRNTVLYELDLTNGEFSKLTDVEVA